MKECVFLLVIVHERMCIAAMKECVFLLVIVHERMCISASYSA